MTVHTITATSDSRCRPAPSRAMVWRRTVIVAGLIGAMLASAGCDEGIKALEEKSEPLWTIPIKVTGDISKMLPKKMKAEDVNLRVGLVWAGVPNPPRFCIEAMMGLAKEASATAVAEKGCRDIFGFVPSLIQASAPIGKDGTALLEIEHLPTAEVLVGTPEGRVAYGSLVIYDDRDNDRALKLRRGNHTFTCREQHGPGNRGKSSCGPEFEEGDGKGKVARTEGGEGSSGGQATPPAGGSSSSSSGDKGGNSGNNGEGNGGDGGDGKKNNKKDRKEDWIWGASWTSMIQPHVRVAFREGSFDVASLFYPTVGCDPPPQGFSLIDVSGLPTASSCEVRDKDAGPVTIALEATETVSDVACTNDNFHFHDSRRKPDTSQPWVCTAGNRALIAANTPSLCKGLSAVSIVGCRSTAACKEPDWDFTKTPPTWWPCGEITELEDEKNGKGDSKSGGSKN